MFIEILFLILGLIGLWFSAELTIKCLTIIAHKFNISETFVGLTILSIGTSLPEIGTHILSSLNILKGNDLSGLAISANIGSNTIQITAILGIVALFLKIKSDKKFLDKDYLVMLLSIILLFVLGYNGKITRLEGIFLFLLYLIYVWKLADAEHFVEKITHHHSKKHLAIYIIGIPIGLTLLWFTSKLVVTNADIISNIFNIKDTFIGAIILGLGTALPELATAIVAIKRKMEEMSIGVLIGSNITNPLAGIGIGAIISGYTMPQSILWLDLPFWFFVSILALLFFWRKLHLEKKEAFMLIACYIIYITIKIKFMV